MHVKVTGYALNIQYYFWWRDYCFGLIIQSVMNISNNLNNLISNNLISVMNISISDY